MKALLSIVLNILPLALIGYGTYIFNKPLAYIVIGALIWVDILLHDQRGAGTKQ